MSGSLKKIAAVFALACFITAFSGGTAHAAEISLPNGFVIADTEGIRTSNDGGYMMIVTDIMPGDIIIKTLTLQNLDDDTKSYELYMTAEPAESTGPVNLVEHSQMLIELDGHVIYTGPVDGISGGLMQHKALDLGEYSPGNSKIAKITIKINDDWNIGYAENKTVFRWNFHANKNEQADPPQTGELITYSLYILSGVMFISLFILFIMHKKRDKNELTQPVK